MPTQQLHPIREAILCLLDFQIAVKLKRLLVEVASNPPQTFWNYIAGIQTDRAAIEWCKVLGDRGERTHWRQLIAEHHHASMLARILAGTGTSEAAWEDYWRGMTDYRNKRAAHADIDAPSVVTAYPHFDLALAASTIVFNEIYALLPDSQRGGLNSSIETWSNTFVGNMRPIVINAFNGSKSLGSNVPAK